jgi:hypothetical protein
MTSQAQAHSHSKPLNKSIFINYLLFGRASYGHGIMISLAKKPSYSAKLHNFTFKLPNSEISINRQIEAFEHPEYQDIISWSNSFRETATQCKWREDESFAILTSVVEKSFHYTFTLKESLTTKLDSLVGFFYPENHSNRYLKKLQNIRQKNFVYIQEYDNKISELLLKYSTCLNLTPSEVLLRKSEYFLAGLSSETQLNMVNAGLNTYEEIKNRILETENLIETLAHDKKGV